MSARGWILLIALGVIWGMPYLLIRIAVEEMHPVTVAFGRTVLGAIVLLPFALREGSIAAAFRNWHWLLPYTIVEITVPWLLIGYAETRLNSSTTGLLLATIPLIAGLLAVGLGHEQFDRARQAGLVLALAGVGALIGLDIQSDQWPAMLALFVSALGYAVGPIIVARKLGHLQPLGVVAGSLILAAALYAPFAAFAIPAAITPQAAWSIVGLGVLCTAIAFVLLFALIAEAGAARATLVAYLNPAVAVLLGAAVLDEPLTLGMGLGFLLIIGGSILAAGGTIDRNAKAPREA
jgi:drug/metabolite transporter (DMT)-like permease